MMVPDQGFKAGRTQATRRRICWQRNIMRGLHTPAPGICCAAEYRSALFAYHNHSYSCAASSLPLWHHTAPPQAAQPPICRYASNTTPHPLRKDQKMTWLKRGFLAFTLISCLPAATTGAAPAPPSAADAATLPATPAPLPASVANPVASTSDQISGRAPDTELPATQTPPQPHSVPVPVPVPVPENYRLSGTLGPYPIGATFSVLPDQTLAGAHYFYVKTLVDIPLSGQFSGAQAVLTEPGGGRFTLHFETNDKNARVPLSFYTSTALTGTWTDGKKTYPVTLNLDSSDHLSPGALYEDVTNALPAAFEAMVQGFLRSVLSGNKAQTAKFVSWPLTVNITPRLIIKNPAALSASWSRIFTPCTLTRIRQAVPHEMFVHHEQAMVSNGTVWFSAHGASTINGESCPASAKKG
nr:hypothetical protein [uncultured Acetobacter sp.]